LRDILRIDASWNNEALKANVVGAFIHLLSEAPDKRLEEALEEMSEVQKKLADCTEDELRELTYTHHCIGCSSIPLIYRRILNVDEKELKRREKNDDVKWEVVCLKCLRRRADLSHLSLSNLIPDGDAWKDFSDGDVSAIRKHYVDEKFDYSKWKQPSFSVNVSEAGIAIPVLTCTDVENLWKWNEDPSRTEEELNEVIGGLLGKKDKRTIRKGYTPSGKFKYTFQRCWNLFMKGHLYWQFTLDEGMDYPPHILRLLLALKEAFNTWPLTVGNRTDFWRATLALVGTIGRWTGFHVDYAGAINIAFQLGGIFLLGKTLAVWFFVAPQVWVEPNLKAALEDFFQKDLNCKGGIPQWKGMKFTRSSFAKLQERLGDRDGGKKLAYVIEQKHGDIVQVQPGHGHFVLNEYPNVKFAFDYFDLNKSDVYVEVWQKIHTLLAESNADDYIGGEVELGNSCLKLLRS
jgi:hypothetical protein